MAAIVTRWMAVSLKLAFAAGIIAVVVLSLLPAKEAPSLFPDKLQHFAAYAVLGLVGGFAFPGRRAAVVVGLVVLAIALELGQHFAPGRSTEIADAVASGIGACCALVPRLYQRS